MEALQATSPDKDEAFWASVLKRWSDACDTVVSLKKDIKSARAESERLEVQVQTLRVSQEGLLRERDRLQEECKKYRDQSHVLLKEKEAFLVSHHRVATAPTTPAPDEQTLNKLREAEDGLEKVKQEYAKLRDKVRSG
ncbi:hypothetical protein H0H81_003799 [Sphagnurus paluster]|uniref:Uncharacterized protein n=1 Tax=Sphagnurus paluster TaxID=117069 RepID=A0A9P7KJ94_9AGAR|nr:hypothetical protein H0H81_003799 [Sphagnurus paluster]